MRYFPGIDLRFTDYNECRLNLNRRLCPSSGETNSHWDNTGLKKEPTVKPNGACGKTPRYEVENEREWRGNPRPQRTITATGEER